MTASFFFYDLETSGFNPREARIMQFAGQRTDLQLQPLGEPHNYFIKLTDDVLPEPDAIMVTGITPQQTKADGISEAEFLRIFTEQIAVPDTIFVGFNSVRFDDEFMRYLHYRNFYDPYEWQWQDGRSRWDLLDVMRMTRALRPDGIKWPVDSEGKATNRLELFTGINKLEHLNAHDALGDVQATIAAARLMYNKQTKLFEYLLSLRNKKQVNELICGGQPFVYTSGKYPSEFEKTTVVANIGDHPKKQGALVYDLRHDPEPFVKMSAAQLAEAWRWKKERTDPPLPVKTLQFNRCPAVAPLGVLDQQSQTRLKLDLKVLQENHKKLKHHKEFHKQLLEALTLLDKERQTELLANELDVDSQLYDGFFPAGDKTTMRAIRAADPSEITSFKDALQDVRLHSLLPLYKARNYPKFLDDEERGAWEAYREKKLLQGGAQSRINRYMIRLSELAGQKLTKQQQYVLEELQLYAESILG